MLIVNKSGTSSSTTHLDDSVSSPNGTVRSIRGIAATEVNINIFLIHQDEAGDFSYMTYYNEGQSGWKDRVKIPLDSPAAPNTSIACTSWNTTGIIVSIMQLGQGGQSTTMLTLHNAECSKLLRRHELDTTRNCADLWG